jgi:hypothetical protein
VDFFQWILIIVRTKPRRKLMGRVPLKIVVIAIASTICIQAHAEEKKTTSRDVGLVMKITGDVVFTPAGAKEPDKVSPQMKTRSGDRFLVPQDGLLQVLYFDKGREETWKGKASVTIGTAESAGKDDGGKPKLPDQVKNVTKDAMEGVRKIPAILRRAGLVRGGGMTLMGGKERKESAETPKLTPEELSDIADARETYKALREKSAEDDIIPELYLIGVLADFDQYEDMVKAAKDALARQPENATVKGILKWAEEKAKK